MNSDLLQNIRIINDSLNVNPSISITDYASVVALLISVGTIIWQWYDRIKESKEQRIYNRKTEIIRKWTAEYPYKLRIYSEFYDFLYKFLSLPKDDVVKLVSNIEDLKKQIYKLCIEADILFYTDITSKMYDLYNELLKIDFNFDEQQYVQDVTKVQKNITSMNLDLEFREKFKRAINISGLFTNK